jgi:hypothetical protein
MIGNLPEIKDGAENRIGLSFIETGPSLIVPIAPICLANRPRFEGGRLIRDGKKSLGGWAVIHSFGDRDGLKSDLNGDGNIAMNQTRTDQKAGSE